MPNTENVENNKIINEFALCNLFIEPTEALSCKIKGRVRAI